MTDYVALGFYCRYESYKKRKNIMQDKLSVNRRHVLKAGGVLGLGAGLGTNMSLLLPSPKTLPDMHYTKII